MKMSEFDYFPAKLAMGEQFCNREKEKKFLADNILKCRHTVLIGPRRYGKSSLVFQTMDMPLMREHNIPLASIDLFLAHDDNAVIKRMLEGVSQAISRILPIDQKILIQLQAIFGKFRVSLGAYGFHVDAALEHQAALNAVDHIFSALEGLNRLAKEQKKKLVFFIDEFQDIKEAESARAIQGAIRHIAQETSEITFIFSGSNRRLLLELFDERSQPLYMLCDRLSLERIASVDYRKHLRKLAEKRWHKAIAEPIEDKIFALTELHPYYINLLCHELWQASTPPERSDSVIDAWEICCQTHEDRFVAELEKLTAKQQDILKALAIQPVTTPTGLVFSHRTKASVSTINQTMRSLMDKDMIFKVKKLDDALPHVKLNQLRVLDPLLAYFLTKYA